jgi:hypothetical protein
MTKVNQASEANTRVSIANSTELTETNPTECSTRLYTPEERYGLMQSLIKDTLRNETKTERTIADSENETKIYRPVAVRLDGLSSRKSESLRAREGIDRSSGAQIRVGFGLSRFRKTKGIAALFRGFREIGSSQKRPEDGMLINRLSPSRALSTAVVPVRFRPCSITPKGNVNGADNCGARNIQTEQLKGFDTRRVGRQKRKTSIPHRYRIGIGLFLCVIASTALCWDFLTPARSIKKTPISYAAKVSRPSQTLKPSAPVKRIIDKRQIASGAINSKPASDERDDTGAADDDKGRQSIAADSPIEREAVDHLIAGRFQDALILYSEVTRQRPEERVYEVISRILRRYSESNCTYQSTSGDDRCITVN